MKKKKTHHHNKKSPQSKTKQKTTIQELVGVFQSRLQAKVKPFLQLIHKLIQQPGLASTISYYCEGVTSPVLAPLIVPVTVLI